MKRHFLSVLFLCVFCEQAVWAQEVVEIRVTESVAEGTPNTVRAELLDKAVQRVSFENIESFIGKEKVEKSREVIVNKIIKNSNKYILASKSGGVQKAPDGKSLELTVDMRVSLKNLRTLLLEEGLLYQMDGPPKLLPAVRIIDRFHAASFNWWSDKPSRETSFLTGALKNFQGSLRDELMKIGFYSMNPLEGNYGDSVPEAYRVQSPQRGDLLFLGELFKSSIVLRGDIIFREQKGSEGVYAVDFRLQAMQTQNGRILAEVVRVYEAGPGDFRNALGKKFSEVAPKVAADLAAQMNEAWKQGTFGSSLMRLVVDSQLPPKEMDEFKKQMVLQIRDIKALRERLLESSRTTYEMDSSAPAQQVAQALRTAKFSRFKVQVQDVNLDSVRLEVSKL